jgi:hypothetical protein
MSADSLTWVVCTQLQTGPTTLQNIGCQALVNSRGSHTCESTCWAMGGIVCILYIHAYLSII